MAVNYQVGPTSLKLEKGFLWPLDSSLGFVTETGHADWVGRRSDMSLEIPKTEVLFDSAGSWKVFKGSSPDELDFVISFNDRVKARMLVNESTKSIQLNWQGEMGWTFPLDELFFINSFAESDALLIHSMSVIVPGKGYIFCGDSGAGKSTLGRILEDKSYNVLCDERNVIRFKNKEAYMFSSPFYGSGEQAKCGSGPLEAIIYLDPRQSGCSFEKISPVDYCSHFFKTVFLPQYSPVKIEKTLSTLERILEVTPVFKLSYDKTSVDIAEFLEAKLFSQ